MIIINATFILCKLENYLVIDVLTDNTVLLI